MEPGHLAKDTSEQQTTSEQAKFTKEYKEKEPLFCVFALAGARVPTETLTSGRFSFGGAQGDSPIKDAGFGLYFTT